MSDPDCLVLHLEEYNDNIQIVDTSLYIFYDKKQEFFVIRGKRKHECSDKFIPYSFICISEKDLADFIKYVICPFNKVKEILYNFPDLPANSNEITYNFLQNYNINFYIKDNK